MKSKDLVRNALCTAVMVICAWISIPMTVPFTLQTMGVFFALFLLGGKKGTIAVTVYILLGVVGLPVFSGFKSGIGTLFNVTGGYILGFFLICITVWINERLFGKKGAIWSMVIGLILCYTFGTVWFVVLYSQNGGISIISALTMCVFPFIIPDVCKLAAARIASRLIRKVVK